MANAWLAHVKRTMKAHKGQKFSAILKLAKKSYKKHRGGADEGAADGADVPAAGSPVPPTTGGRRRSSRRTRRHRRR